VETPIIIPFTCLNYRANVRVVDFYPHKLEDFAVSRRMTEYDILDDDNGGTDSDDSDGDNTGTLSQFAAQRIWEWRFALKLEDASPKIPPQKPSCWVVVDNVDAQLLVGLDACE
jgi:protection of telomeres protein 1